MAKGFKIAGVKDTRKILRELAPREARNLNRATIQGLAARTAKEAKPLAPKRSGILRRAIRAKRERAPPDKPRSTVRVTQGKQQKYDAFYWRFVERGTRRRQKAVNFLGRAFDWLKENYTEIYRQEFGKKYTKLLARKAKKAKT